MKDIKVPDCLRLGMQQNSIVLDSSSDLSSPVNREIIKRHLDALDQRLLSDEELRQSFDVLKLLMSAFIQKVNTLESCIETIRRDQELSNQRMEGIYLKSQLEISALRAEIKSQRLSKRRFDQVIKVAETLKDNPYAPYAIRGLIDKSFEQKVELPADFARRLQFAQANGFRWNQNNRVPQKADQRILLVEKWEQEFNSAVDFSLEQLLDKNLVKSRGSGAVAAALIALEQRLGGEIPERTTLSIFNCYLKAAKQVKQAKILPSRNSCPLLALFDPADHEQLLAHLEGVSLSTDQDYTRFVKRVCTKTFLPTGLSLAQIQAADFELSIH